MRWNPIWLPGMEPITPVEQEGQRIPCAYGSWIRCKNRDISIHGIEVVIDTTPGWQRQAGTFTLAGVDRSGETASVSLSLDFACANELARYIRNVSVRLADEEESE